MMWHLYNATTTETFQERDKPTLFIFTFGQFPIFENLANMEQITWPSGHTGHD